ncbi:MAG: DUF885 domain-containing protein [Bacteroides sp.]|nr:DUF885 domain-containing protein [Bacillota bacterium]MCM1455376.1 DUF885 domain-containing protein [Bacteroides sp.]
MKRYSKRLVCVVAVIMIAVCATFGLSACNFDKAFSKQLNTLADQMAYLMLGNDAYTWNVFSVDPKNSYGYEQYNVATWYSYSPVSDEDCEELYSLFNYFDFQLGRIKLDKLKGQDIATYYTLRHTIDTYLSYYGNYYSSKFSLIGGDYISSQGGYVADFTSAVENYAFRNTADIDNLLSIVQSTDDAFKSYLDFARDRAYEGNPLYDYTIVEMQDYLDEILEQGDDYYLYGFIDNKIDAAEFLNNEQKASYKQQFNSALKYNFMKGVEELSLGLENYKGAETTINKSYLGAFGNAGAAYYKWSFENKTGLKNVDMDEVFQRLAVFNNEYAGHANAIIEQVEAVKDTNPQLYEDFYAYVNGEKQILDLTDPEDILTYVKGAAKDIVPELKHEPAIDFKYMDDTVAKRSMTLAYYLRSPLDEVGSTEHITLNPYYIENSPSDPLLPTIAHEGYPGHLYASVNAKEQGVSLLTGLNTVSAFVEGWAVYTQLKILNIISETCENDALSLYCDYLYYDTVAGYISPILYDIEINYNGATAQELSTVFGIELDRAQHLIEALMEMPAVYVSYGYGAYYMLSLHDLAKDALGDKYDEVEFNAALLSEGMGPTLERAEQITEEYIQRKSK